MILAQATIGFSPKVVAKVIVVFFLGIILLGFVSPALAAHGCEGNKWDFFNSKASVRRLVPVQTRGVGDPMPNSETKNKPSLESRRSLRTSPYNSVPSPLSNRPHEWVYYTPPPHS
ncbi:hypothetical protein Nepgr_018614 [Nepenthes gracilis]|uniref:Uncharacterized protein n=1 Tax=Nepenthes gracilis TaxID=150966 RepID=A0AAD3SRN6_NEPGR|nr:hypothetical protein Nepgr_018614 [Nepenthes gracilis]